MGRFTGSVCRLCRREGIKLYLKGSRCYTDKCAIERRNFPPGQHGQARKRVKEYGTQLREQQKLKRFYGILEAQFRRYFRMADRGQGMTGLDLLQYLERRCDNVVYRLGFATSRRQARQHITHGHLCLNGRKVTSPSLLVKVGDVVSVRPKSRNRVVFQGALAEGRTPPSWLELEREDFSGTVRGMPAKEEIGIPVNESLVVEFYSR